MTTYAGEVRIKTRLDAAGINEGMKKLSSSLANAGAIVAKVIAGAVAGAVVGVVALATGIALLIKNMMKMEGFKQKFSELQLAFANLKNAAYSALMPLIEALLPAIMQIVTWLTYAANVAAAFFAKLAGASTYSVYVANSLGNAAGSSGEYADNMERAEEAAKGSLASFDKLNVLSKEEEPKMPGTGGGGGGASGAWVVKDVEETLDKVTGGWKSFIDGLFQLFTGGGFSGLGQWFNTYVWQPMVEFAGRAWGTIKEWVISVWETIKESAIGTWILEHIIEPLKTVWDDLKVKFGEFAAFFTEKVVGPLKEKFGNLVEKWQEFAKVIKEVIIDKLVIWFNDFLEVATKAFEFAFGWWKGLFAGVFDAIAGIVKGALEILTAIIGMIIDVIAGIITFLTGVFSGDWEKAWQGIQDIFIGIWEGIKGTLKGVINAIIGFINGMIRGIVDGINAVIGLLNKLNFKIPDWVPGLGGETFGFNIATMTAPQIPMLATGAVIPANAPFAAILGDQKHGTNIEAPESLLRDLIREELGRNQSRQDTIHNVIKLDGQVLYEAVKKIDKRVGTSLISGSGIR